MHLSKNLATNKIKTEQENYNYDQDESVITSVHVYSQTLQLVCTHNFIPWTLQKEKKMILLFAKDQLWGMEKVVKGKEQQEQCCDGNRQGKELLSSQLWTGVFFHLLPRADRHLHTHEHTCVTPLCTVSKSILHCLKR